MTAHLRQTPVLDKSLTKAFLFCNLDSRDSCTIVQHLHHQSYSRLYRVLSRMVWYWEQCQDLHSWQLWSYSSPTCQKKERNKRRIMVSKKLGNGVCERQPPSVLSSPPGKICLTSPNLQRWHGANRDRAFLVVALGLWNAPLLEAHGALTFRHLVKFFFSPRFLIKWLILKNFLN